MYQVGLKKTLESVFVLKTICSHFQLLCSIKNIYPIELNTQKVYFVEINLRYIPEASQEAKRERDLLCKTNTRQILQ